MSRRAFFFGGFLSGLGDTLGNVVLIMFTVIFVLADALSFPRKLSINSGARSEKSLAALQELAAIPSDLLYLLEVSPVLYGMIIALYLVINTLMGNVIEPALIGRRVGLSTLGVFLSLVFWG